MNDVITAIKNGVQSTQNVKPNINFTYPTTVFDDDIGIEDPDDNDEVDDHPNGENFNKYSTRLQELSTIQQQQSLSPDNTINSLLQDIFANRHRRERQDEIDEYMMIEEIDVSTCPFKWNVMTVKRTNLSPTTLSI
ncbi:unnamed protein product [Rhizophagus irregularis]|nr:unnamed protein product [Rhizophagus irregularis]